MQKKERKEEKVSFVFNLITSVEKPGEISKTFSKGESEQIGRKTSLNVKKDEIETENSKL